MLKKDLAAALGISATMVGRLERRGMPLHSVDAARRWREQNLERTRMKGVRADGNTGRGYISQRSPGSVGRTVDESHCRPGAAELVVFYSAALFTAKFGVERFGPLLMHVCCKLSDDAHALIDEAHRRGEDPMPQAVQDAWDAISDVYFEWLPPLSQQAAEVKWHERD